MKTMVLVIFTIVAISACNTRQPNFSRMTEEELFQYNSTVGFFDQVFCQDEVRSGSHIRTRHCSTYGNTLGVQAQRLPTPSSNTSSIYGP